MVHQLKEEQTKKLFSRLDLHLKNEENKMMSVCEPEPLVSYVFSCDLLTFPQGEV